MPNIEKEPDAMVTYDPSKTAPSIPDLSNYSKPLVEAYAQMSDAISKVLAPPGSLACKLLIYSLGVPLPKEM